VCGDCYFGWRVSRRIEDLEKRFPGLDVKELLGNERFGVVENEDGSVGSIKPEYRLFCRGFEGDGGKWIVGVLLVVSVFGGVFVGKRVLALLNTRKL
jgi:hypothetical protein